MIRRLLAGALLATLAALPLSSGAVEPYEINAIIPQTGSSAFLGRAFTITLGVIETMVNSQGGIRGRPVKFVIADDQSNPQVAVQLIGGLIARHVPVIVGPSATANCDAALPLLKDGPVMYCLAVGVHAEPGSFVFSAGVSTLATLQVLARYFRERGWYRVGIITSIDATGQEAEQSMNQALGAEEPETIVDREHFSVTDISVAAQMSHLAASSAQVIVAWTVGTPFGTLIRGIHDAGISLPVAGSNANLSYQQLRPLGPYLPKELYFAGIPSAASVEQLPKGPMRNAQSTYMKAFEGAGVQPEVGEYQMWDEVLIVVDALRKLGLDATAPQIRDYIDGLRDWVGVHGPYDFAAFPQRGIGSSSIAVARWDQTRGTWENVSLPGGALLPPR